MALQQPLFRKKNVIHLLNLFCAVNTDETNKHEQAIIAFIKDLFEKEDLTKDSKEYEIAINRIRDYLEGIYNQSQSYERISENILNEQIGILKKVLKRENFSKRELPGTKTELERNFFITRLKLKNWMMFEDKEIIFRGPQDRNTANQTDNKNIIIFHGENTSGKSNIFNAIKMAILGPKNFLSTQELSKRTNPNDFMRDFVARAAIKKALEQNIETFEMEIALDFQITDKSDPNKFDNYTIIRTWNVRVTGDIEDTKIMIYGNDQKFIKIESYGMNRDFEEKEFMKIFEKFIPNVLQKLFITDKEILGKKIIEDPEKFIQEHVRLASEYEAFDDMAKLLNDINKKIRSDFSSITESKLKGKNKELNELQSKNKELEKEIQGLNSKIQKNRDLIEENNKEIDNLELQTKDFKNDEFEQYNKLQKEKNEIEKKIQLRNKEKDEILNSIYITRSLGPIFTSAHYKELLNEAKNKLKKEPERSNYCDIENFYDLLEKMLQTKKCICEREITPEIEQMIDKQKRRSLIIDQNAIFNHISNTNEEFEVNHEDKVKNIENLNANIAQLLNLKKQTENELNIINPATFRGNMKDLIKKISELRKKNEKLEESNEGFNRDIQIKQNEIENNQKSIEILIAEIKDPELAKEKKDFENKINFVSLCKEINSTLQKRFDVLLTEHVAKMMTEYFKKIDWEGKYWRGFKIDENWRLLFVNEAGQTITLASEAQKKIIMISFICALIDIRKIKIPWIIDNVLSDLSGENVRGLALHACGNQDFPQQFFFFTEDEWNRIRQFIEGKVVQKFVFNKLSSDRTELKEEPI